MIIAVRPLMVDGKRILPGEQVPGFDKWDLSVQRAHLNLEWVRVEEPRVAHPKQKKGKKSEKQGG